MMKPDQERVKNLLADTVTLLCKNGLNFRKKLRVQGLIAITLDDDDVFIVQIDERLPSADDSTAVEDMEKESRGKFASSSSSSSPPNENHPALDQTSDTDNGEKLISNSAVFPVRGSCREPSEFASNSDAIGAIVKIEKVETSSVEEQPGLYDRMVDFASFLPDFSSARYATDLSALHQGNLALPGLAAADIPLCSKRMRNSVLPLDLMAKSSGDECTDSGLRNEGMAQGNLAAMAFPASQGLIRQACASSHCKTSDFLLDQNSAADVTVGLIDEYSRARGTSSAFFDLGVDCNNQSIQGFDSQQVN